jgi:16S rRNA (adenine1518-N6/adenine1519-N6)-dimethyltransferase
MTLPPLDVTGLLNRYHLQPNKRLGQNFLVDEKSLVEIVQAGDPGASDVVLEIGAGLGSLTRLLAQRAHEVLAVELDHNLIPALSEVLSGFDNVNIIQGDFLEINMAELLGAITQEHGFIVVANIPYYITSALIRMLLEAQLKPSRMVLTVQQEVAERIKAEDGKLSLLA